MMISVDPKKYHNKPLPRKRKEDGTLHHVQCNGHRQHVIWWTGKERLDGTVVGVEHCSEPECEINFQGGD